MKKVIRKISYADFFNEAKNCYDCKITLQDMGQLIEDNDVIVFFVDEDQDNYSELNYMGDSARPDKFGETIIDIIMDLDDFDSVIAVMVNGEFIEFEMDITAKIN